MKIYENNLDDIFALVAILPDRLSSSIRTIGNFEDLIEIVMDIGRPPLARYTHEEIRLSDFEITADDIEYVIKNVGDFDLDNRAGMERTLHRISAIRNRKGKIVGLTCRVGTGSIWYAGNYPGFYRVRPEHPYFGETRNRKKQRCCVKLPGY